MALLPIQIPPGFAERFWSKVSIGAPDDCWPWIGAIGANGRGRLKCVGRKDIQAHRAAWLLAVSAIPDGLCVLHRCDNMVCCNSRHLWLGTQAQNMADMASKGRAQRGEKHVNAKLTPALVASIRKDNRLHREIAADLGVSASLISMVKSGDLWRDV